VVALRPAPDWQWVATLRRECSATSSVPARDYEWLFDADGAIGSADLARLAPLSGNGRLAEYSGLPDDVDVHVRI
jgi:hypothetical protein